MRIIHIVPSAFDYFNDIKKVAFELVEGLSEAGIENEVITLQYTTPTKFDRAEVREKAPSTHYAGLVNFPETIKKFNEFDIVFLHSPFLGAAGEIIKWKKENPDTCFVAAYYRDIPFTDLFSLFLKWYNSHYLPKIFIAADIVLCPSVDGFLTGASKNYLKNQQKLAEFGLSGENVHLTESANKVKLLERDEAVKNLVNIFHTLI